MVSVPSAGRPEQVPPRKSAADGTAELRQMVRGDQRPAVTGAMVAAPKRTPAAPQGLPISGLQSRIAGVSYAAAANPPAYLGRLGSGPAIATSQVADIVAATVRALQSGQLRPVVAP